MQVAAVEVRLDDARVREQSFARAEQAEAELVAVFRVQAVFGGGVGPLSLRVDEQGFAVYQADFVFFPGGDEAIAVFPVAEAEVVAAFAEEFAAVVVVGFDVATQAEVVVVAGRVLRRDAVEGVEAAVFL